MNLQECREYVLNFLKNSEKKDLKEQLKWLRNFNFSKLAKVEKVDEDNTKLAKAIYFIIHNNSRDNEYSLPHLVSWENMEYYYGGETINTFNTLFQSEFLGIQDFVPLQKENAEFYIDVIKFRINYLTIGNFMLLPKLSVEDSTLNRAKGTCYGKYKDYADLFFMELFKENSNEQYLKDANSFYFNEISPKEFCEKNFLEDYFENDKPKQVFATDKNEYPCYPYYYWQPFKDKLGKGEEYRNFSIDYIKKATNIIEKRAKKITDILYSRL